MWTGEAAGLVREDLVPKGSLDQFFHVRPNEQRLLKMDAAARYKRKHKPFISTVFSKRDRFVDT
jgi:hypothetical protein